MDIMIGILIIVAITTAGTAIGLEIVQDKKREQEKTDKNRCPQCDLPFSDWFWWPGKGDYCWPCYKATGKIFVRKARK